MRLSPSRSCLVAGVKPRRVLPRAGAITSRFESLESSGGVETNELPLAPRDATQTRVWSWSRFRHNFQALPRRVTRQNSTLPTSFAAPRLTWTSLSTLAVSTANRLWSTRLLRDSQCTSGSDERGDTDVCPQGAQAMICRRGFADLLDCSGVLAVFQRQEVSP